MGKKSKSKGSKSPPCYHGCATKKDFNFGRHYTILERWDKQSNSQKERNDFYEQYKRVLLDPTFGCFTIAHITDGYLKGQDDDLLLGRLFLLLRIRYRETPRHEGKDIGPESKYTKDYQKYCRDVLTERGRINCIAREIPCKCMEENENVIDYNKHRYNTNTPRLIPISLSISIYIMQI